MCWMSPLSYRHPVVCRCTIHVTMHIQHVLLFARQWDQVPPTPFVLFSSFFLFYQVLGTIVNNSRLFRDATYDAKTHPILAPC